DGGARGERERRAPEPRDRRAAEWQRRERVEAEVRLDEVLLEAEGQAQGEGEGQELAVRLAGGALVLLDQTALPDDERWLRLTSAEEVADAIRRLAVRGA